MTRFDVNGNPIELSVPDTFVCAVCSETAERCSSVDEGKGDSRHNYRCRTCRDAGRIDGGTIVERKGEVARRIGPVFRNPCNRIDESQPVSQSPTDAEVNPDTETEPILMSTNPGH